MLKLFCKCCHGFIKEVEPLKAGKLTGMEICEDCSGTMQNAIDEINKLSKRSQFAIQKKADKAVADLEFIMSKILKGD